MSEIKLEPCKYCGRNGKIKHSKDRVTVECETADYAAAVFISSEVSADQAEREAVQRWNDRQLVPVENAEPACESCRIS